MKLKELLKDVKTISPYDENREIGKIAVTSADVENNCIYIAVRGEKHNGYSYLDKVRQSDCVIIKDEGSPSGNEVLVENSSEARSLIWRNFYGNPSAGLIMSGITGTNGKTTVTYLTRHIFERSGFRTGIIGTVVNITGGEEESAVQTTPAPSELHQLFRKMSDNRLDHAVLEVSSHSLIQSRVYGVRFKAGAFTNLTQDHLDYHKNFDEYLKAKLKLVDLCEGFAVNADDPYGRNFYNRSLSVCERTLTYGIRERADITAFDISSTRKGSNFKVKYLDRVYSAYIGIPGGFSVYNALAAIAVSVLNGLDIGDCINHLKSASGIKGRMETVDTGKDFSVFIDYAHTPDGLENVLRTLNEVKGGGRLITVFGCGGDRDRTKRPVMGRIAEEGSDVVIVTSDNPRTEEPLSIIEDIMKGIDGTKKPVIVNEDRRLAIRAALELAGRGDIVLIAGKGHENYQILKDKTIPFDEREIIKDII